MTSQGDLRCSSSLGHVTPYVAAFEAAFAAENAQRELARLVRQSSQQLTSPYAFIRMDGLKVLLRLLHDLASLPTPNGSPLDIVGASIFPAAEVFAKSDAAHRWNSIHNGLRANVTSSVFHMIFPRRDLAMALCGPGGPPIPKLDPQSAIEWSTARMANSKAASSGVSGLVGEVTLMEQELALRLVQGLCVVVPVQKQYISDSPLLPLVSEVMGLCLQHVHALRDAAAASRKPSSAALKPPPTGEETAAASLVSSAAPISGPVVMDSALLSVLVAMVDAVEAACHYSPRVLAQVAQLGTVRHMLNLAACSAAPVDLRCAIFDTVSFLMQEVAPFRRAVVQPVSAATAASPTAAASASNNGIAAAGGAAGTAGGVSSPEQLPNLVIAMLDETLVSARKDPPPFLMDRASASKFDSSVRDWFSLHKLTSLVPSLFHLRDVTGTAIPSGTAKHEIARYVQRSARQRERLFAEFLSSVDSRSVD